MASKFNLIEALKENGFTEVNVAECSPFYGCVVLERDWSKEVDVLWYGKQESKLHVEIWFNNDMTVCQAYYFDGGRRAFKEKTHLSDKKAFNAIKATVENKDFQF